MPGYENWRVPESSEASRNAFPSYDFAVSTAIRTASSCSDRHFKNSPLPSGSQAAAATRSGSVSSVLPSQSPELGGQSPHSSEPTGSTDLSQRRYLGSVSNDLISFEEHNSTWSAGLMRPTTPALQSGIFQTMSRSLASREMSLPDKFYSPFSLSNKSDSEGHYELVPYENSDSLDELELSDVVRSVAGQESGDSVSTFSTDRTRRGSGVFNIWNRHNAPTVRDICQRTLEGCHLCNLIWTSLEIEEDNNRASGIRLKSLESSISESDVLKLDFDQYGTADNLGRSLFAKIIESRRNGFITAIRLNIMPMCMSIRSMESNAPNRADPFTLTEEIAKTWLQECLMTHGNPCHHLAGGSALPTRVIDVRGRSGSDEPFLMISNGKMAPYATLSYCWGRKEMLTTTRSTLAERLSKIHLHSLPRTLQDAVLFTRALDLQYLWVDALCIIQDSLDDCSQEMGHMADIYANATVTIAAVGARDVQQGCPPSRNKLAMIDCQITPDIVVSADLRRQHEQPLGRSLCNRAWCFQEVQLSPRLLSVGGKELYFQCSQGWRREGDPANLVRQLADREAINSPLHARFVSESAPRDPRRAYSLWLSYVRDFAELDLTFPVDKLAAISALAARFPSLIPDGDEKPSACDYFAGIWRADLVRGLLWYRHKCRPSYVTSAYRAPSWSWAACDGWVEFEIADKPSNEHQRDFEEEEDIVAEILEIRTTPVSDFSPFGPVHAGKLVVYAPFSRLPPQCLSTRWVDWDRWDEFQPYRRCYDFYCLLLKADFGLVLAPVGDPGGDRFFRRLGRLHRSRFYGRRGKKALEDPIFEWRYDAVTVI